MKLQKIFIALVLLLSTFKLFAQENKSTLSGTIIVEGKATEGVTIQLKGKPHSVITDHKGYYTLTAEPGNYTLVISYIGFKTSETAIVLKPGATLKKDITLEEDSTVLNEVQLTSKSTVERVREQAYNITAVDLKPLHNTSTDLNQVLNRTPGIRVRETGGMGSDFKFSLNGFSGNQVRFFLDGIPIDNYGSAFTLNNMPANLAERIEVYKGVVPIELGSDALGGAVNIITNRNVNQYIDASYTYGSFNTHKTSINTHFTNKNGIVTNINVFANYSDNDFKVNVSSTDHNTGRFGEVKKYRHFHDAYKQAAVMAEVGVKGKKYADYLLLGTTIYGNKKEIQQGTNMQKVVGDAFTDSKSLVPSLKYKKSDLFTKGLTASIVASYNILERRAVDTSSARYNWAGEHVIKPEAKGELNPDYKTLAVYNDRSLQTNTNLKYELTDNQYVAFNYSHVGYIRKETEDYQASKDRKVTAKATLNKHILGLSYNLFAFDKKLSWTLFTKMFDFKTKMIPNKILDPIIRSSFNDFGYGSAIAYFITPEVQLKASFEHAYRLPNAEEMLGDGHNLVPNYTLSPEASDNVNTGIAYKKIINKHVFGLQGSFIYRNAVDFIRPKPVGNRSNFENLENVRVVGFDAILAYGYDNWLTFEVNATHQKTKTTNKFERGTNIINDKYGYQVPNEPIFYGNIDLGFKFNNIRSADDNLSININANYSDAYYQKWPELGAKDTKRSIPEQFTQNVVLAYTLANGKYNIALESRNITDVKVYDYFNVQKPGRAFFIKLRYLITK